jgi:hypothetical protein
MNIFFNTRSNNVSLYVISQNINSIYIKNIKILLDKHKKYYKEGKSILKIPLTITERTKNYLEESCDIVQWFKENYQLTNNKKDTIKIYQAIFILIWQKNKNQI